MSSESNKPADNVLRSVSRLPPGWILLSGDPHSGALVRIKQTLLDKIVVIGYLVDETEVEPTPEELRAGLYPIRALLIASDVLPRHLVAVRQELSSLANVETHPGVQKAPDAVIRQIYETYRQRLANATTTTQGDDDPESRRQAATFDRLVRDALEMSASDIHIVQDDDRAHIYYRVHAKLRHISDLSSRDALSLCRAVYNTFADAASRSDPFSEYKLQNSSIRRTYRDGTSVRIRYASTPLLDGFGVVLRLLSEVQHDTRDLSFEELGYAESQARQLREIFAQPHGLFVISGVTGSGKSTTLKHGLRSIIRNRPGEAVYTIEEPVEYRIIGARQMSVTRDGEDTTAFSQHLRQVLRLDPDVVMVGEMRDALTAQLASNAALTGHKVLTTVHATTALDVATRLTGADLQISYDLFASPGFIIGIANQALLPVLCDHCKVPIDLAAWERSSHVEQREFATRLHGAAELCGGRLYDASPHGCEHCRHLGTIGVTVAAEIIIPEDAMRAAWRSGNHLKAKQIWAAYRNAENPRDFTGRSAMEHALSKMLDGIVSPIDLEQRFGYIDGALLREYAEKYCSISRPRVVNARTAASNGE